MDQRVDNNQGVARSVFAGLAPRLTSVSPTDGPRHGRMAKGALATGSVILAGSMAAMGLTGPVSAAEARPLPKPRGTIELGKTIREAVSAATSALSSAVKTATTPAPMTYRVAPGDTVSSIAAQYGLSTASVLALNGLGWSSIIFPGQELTLSSSGTVAPVEVSLEATPSGRYTIVAGDTISGLADRFGVSTLSMLTANGLGWASIIYPGQTLAIPGLIGPGNPADDTSATTDGVEDPADTPPQDPSTFVPVASTAPLEETIAVVPVVEAPPAAAPTTLAYTIVSGDTVGTIAARFGITTQALLDANGLDWASVIFSGHTLTIPATGSLAPAAVSSNGLNDEMRVNAATIVQVGRELGVSDYGIVIALATAMQESSLRNLTWGDLDSVGLFQQRPSSGWGSVEQLTDPVYAARLFYGGPSNPNRGNTRGLLDISGWSSMMLTDAAQRVQISAFPDAYAKWETSAWGWLAELG